MVFGSTNNTKSQLGGSPCNSSRKTFGNYDKMGYWVKTMPPQYVSSSPSWDLFSTTIMIQIARIQPCLYLSRPFPSLHHLRNEVTFLCNLAELNAPPTNPCLWLDHNIPLFSIIGLCESHALQYTNPSI